MEMKGLYFSLVERQMAGKEGLDDLEKVDDDIESPAKYSKQISSKDKSYSVINKEKETTNELKVNRLNLFMRLLALNRPELPFIGVGLLGALLFGASTPLFGAVFGDILSVLSEQDIDKGRKDSGTAALQLGGIGLAYTLPVHIPNLRQIAAQLVCVIDILLFKQG